MTQNWWEKPNLYVNTHTHTHTHARARGSITVALEDYFDRAELRGYVQFNKYTL